VAGLEKRQKLGGGKDGDCQEIGARSMLAMVRSVINLSAHPSQDGWEVMVASRRMLVGEVRVEKVQECKGSCQLRRG